MALEGVVAIHVMYKIARAVGKIGASLLITETNVHIVRITILRKQNGSKRWNGLHLYSHHIFCPVVYGHAHHRLRFLLYRLSQLPPEALTYIAWKRYWNNLCIDSNLEYDVGLKWNARQT